MSIFDLFYIKNFKGGSATFDEPEEEVKGKLVLYTNLLKQIDKKFYAKSLNELDCSQIRGLINFANQGFDLVNSDNEAKIDDFSYSFLTTLLHFYFPNLFPILDRRVLNGLQLINQSDLNSQKQVKNIQSFYPELITAFALRLRTRNVSIRELDKELFTMKFN